MCRLFLIRLKSLLPFFLFVSFLSFLFLLLSKRTEVLIPPVLICNEDDSFTGKMLVRGVLENELGEAIEFREVKKEEGLLAVKEGQASAMLFVEEGTAETLLNGEKGKLMLYLNKMDSGFSRFLIGYLNGFLEMVNISQNSGLLYMALLEEEGLSFEEKEKEFIELQLAYSMKALEREGVIEEEEGFRKKLHVPTLILLSIPLFWLILLLFIRKYEMFQKERKERLLLAGYREGELVLAYALFHFFVAILGGLCLLIFAKQMGIG